MISFIAKERPTARILILLVLALIIFPYVAVASSLNVDIFIKESSTFLGKNVEAVKAIRKKINFTIHERQGNQQSQIFKASNTGLQVENACKEMIFHLKNNHIETILCTTTDNIADKEINKAYKKYPGKGGGVGTGTYAWCIDNRLLEISIPIGIQPYIAVSKQCPTGLKK